MLGVVTQNVVTHKSSEDKQFVTVYWTPPEDFVGSVTFRTTYLKNGTVFWINTSTAYPVRVVNAMTTTISTSTSTEFIPLTTSSTTDGSYSDSTNDENSTIPATTETIFNTTEEDESTSIFTTDKATTTTKSPFPTNKPPNGGTSSEIPLDCHVLLLAAQISIILTFDYSNLFST
uniref:Reelin domain-containing protein n=1 Tax=Daphnia galeata TaxID=27404 RepID=A0A8J2RCZ0_9CRUS|nr:unnamed protein product [Daphnia galeata]